MAVNKRSGYSRRSSAKSSLAAADVGIAAILSIAIFFVYQFTAGAGVSHQSGEPHFVLLADAILHGHLWIDPRRAAELGDITPFAGRFYVSFPPMPALLMLPFVAVDGPGFNDVLFSISLGAVNVGLMYLLIRRVNSPGLHGSGVAIGRPAATAAALLFGLGTVHYYAAASGTVWYVAHVVADTFFILYLYESIGRSRPLLAGLALAAAFLARTPMIFGLVFWVALALANETSPRHLIGGLLRFGSPLAVATFLLLAQNVVRFGSPLDFGYLSMKISPTLAPDLASYGQFSVHFLSRNLAAMFLTPPTVSRNWLQWFTLGGSVAGIVQQFVTRGVAGIPFPVQFDPWGVGLWAVSPALIFSLRPPPPSAWLLYAVAWLSTILIALPDLLYYNTGWVQYGDRFTLDFMPILVLLTALGLRRPTRWFGWTLFAALLVVSVASNFLGTRWFLQQAPY